MNKNTGESLFDNPIESLYEKIDLLFIITIVMSIIALFLSYDRICGEKENQTLKLMSSYAIPKTHIVVGKWLGGTISIFIPYTVSIVFSVVIILIMKSSSYNANNIISFITIVIFSYIYIAFFFSLGLLVSSITKESIVSMLHLLLLWVVFIIIIPEISPYVVNQFIKTPSMIELNEQQYYITQVERDKILNARTKELQKKYAPYFDENANLENLLTQRKSNDPLRLKILQYKEESYNLMEEVNKNQREKFKKIEEDARKKIDLQTKLSVYVSQSSPYANFIYLASDLADAGLSAGKFVIKKMNELIAQEYKYYRDTFNKMKKANPLLTTNDYVDFTKRPRYIYEEEAYLSKLKNVLPYGALLLFFNLAAFILALIQFRRYDVR